MLIQDSPDRERLLADPTRPHDRAAFEAFMSCARNAETCRKTGHAFE